MVNKVNIISGHYEGSSALLVECNEPDGTVIVVYKYVNGTPSQIGTNVLGNNLVTGQSLIGISAIARGNLLVGYVVEEGRQASNPVVVFEQGKAVKTGYRNPSSVTVGGITKTYAAYLSDGGVEIADIYAPEESINNDVERCNEIVTQYTDATLIIEYTTELVATVLTNVAIVNISGFNSAIGTARVSWDGQPFTQVYQQKYYFADNGLHNVVVQPELNNVEEKTIEFTINVDSVVATPTVTDIWSHSYEVNPTDRQVSLLCFCLTAVEGRILITGTESFQPLISNSGNKWNMIPYQNVPNGTYPGEFRLIGQTTVLPEDVRVNI